MRSSIPLVTALACVGLCALGATPALAQQAKVYGVVADASGAPVEKASVLLEPQAGKEGVRATATTNKKGKYFFGLIRPGSYDLTITAPDMILQKVKGKALSPDKKTAWEIDGNVEPGKPWTLVVEDGQDVLLDFTLARGVKAGGGGEGAPQVTSAEGALAGVAKQVEGGDCAGALPQLREIVAASPNLGTAHYLLGYCQANQGEEEAAVGSLTKAMELSPETPGIALLKGQVLSRLDRVEEAEAMIKSEIERAATPAMVENSWIALGILYRDRERPDDAIAAFEKVAELKPERPESYVEIASLHMKAGRPEMAEQVLARAKAAGALDASALLNVGITYLNKKDYEHAGQVFRQVLEAGGNPADTAMAWSLLARTQLHAGQMTEAVVSLEKAQELDPTGPMAEENKEILAQLKK